MPCLTNMRILSHTWQRWVAAFLLLVSWCATADSASPIVEQRPAVWRATVQGDVNLELSGSATIRIVNRSDGGAQFASGMLRPLGITAHVPAPLEGTRAAMTHGRFAGSTIGLGEGYIVVRDAPDPRTGAEGESTDLHSFDGELRVERWDEGIYLSFDAAVDSISAPVYAPSVLTATVSGTLCEVDPSHAGGDWGEVPCLVVDDALEVVENLPGHRQENVDFDDPGIEIAFSDEVALDQVQEHFTLFTVDPDGEQYVIDGEVQRVSEERFTFVPNGPLFAGVIYEARLEGGSSGVATRLGSTLPADHWWRFSTAVVPDDIRVHVYQTVRDAPLVIEKPTLTRVYVDWEESIHFHPVWQVTSFPADVRIVDDVAYDIYPAKRGERIYRPDQYDEEDVRHARHTVNFFNWRPWAIEQNLTLEAHVAPADPYPARDPDAELPFSYRGWRPVEFWPHQPRDLIVDYFLIEVGSWADGVPADEAALARRMMRQAETYTTQIFPVRSTQVRDEGKVSVETGGLDHVPTEMLQDGVEDFLEKFGYDRAQRILRETMQRVHDLHAPYTNADVSVGLFPLEFHQFGQSFTDIDVDWENINVVPDFVFYTVMMPVWEDGPNSAGITHEFGHAYGQHHEPRSDTAAQRKQAVATWRGRTYPGIEGFRIAPSGTHGWNKSSTEGNAEHAEELLSFMFPVALPQSQAFITTDRYEQLLLVFGVHASLPQHGAASPDTMQMAQDPPAVAPVLASWESSTVPPEVTFTAPEAGMEFDAGTERLHVAWKAEAKGTDALRYTLLYSPTGGFPWRVIGAEMAATTYEIEPGELAPGSQAVLRVIAHDGVAEAEATLPLTVVREPVPTAVYPPSDAGADPVPLMLDVSAEFAAPIPSERLEENFVLLDADDAAVPAHMHLNVARQTALLTPKAPLEAETTYTAVLRAGLTDVHGNTLTNDVVWHFTTQAEDPNAQSPDRAHFFDTLSEAFPGEPPESPEADAPGEAGVGPPDEHLGPPPPVGEGTIKIGRQFTLQFPVSCAGAHDGVEAAGVSASDPPLLHATGIIPEDDAPFELTVRRYEGDGDLVHHVTFETDDAETVIAEARHVRSGETWHDMVGEETGPLIHVDDGRITAHGELRFGELPRGLVMVLDAQCG